MIGPVLVTGAGGFVGTSLCYALGRRGVKVSAVVRRDPQHGQSAVGVISSQTNWDQPLRGCEAVVHLAARVHVMTERSLDPLREFRAVNLGGTLQLARRSADLGVRRFVFASSIGVNGLQTELGRAFSISDEPQPHNAYALSKWEAEQGLLELATETGMEVVIIRPPLVYGYGAPGNFGALMRVVKKVIPLPLASVHNQRSLVGIDNVVDLIVTCLDHSQAANETFLVSDGHDLSTSELIRMMADAAGVRARLFPVPVTVLRAAASLLGKAEAVDRLCGNLQVDISKTREVLGWNPPVSVEEGLRRAFAQPSVEK